MTRDQVVTSTRLAGLVRRYHTWPVLRTQTVAEHSWQVMRVFQLLFPDDMTAEVWDHILWHDVAEIGTGDIPAYMKQEYPDLKQILDAAEAVVLEGMGVSLPALSDADHVRIKIAELIERAEFGAEERMMGNRFAEPIIHEALAAARGLALAHGLLGVVTSYTQAVGLVREGEWGDV